MTDERCQSNLNAFGNARVSFGHANRDVPLGCLHCVSVHSESPCVTVRVVCVQVAHNGTLLLRFMSDTKLQPFHSHTSFLPCSTSRSSKIPHAGCTVRRSDRWALPRPMRRRRVRRRRPHRRLPRNRRTSSSSTAYSSSSRASPVRSLEDTNEAHAHMLCTPTQERVTCKPRRPRNWWQTCCSRARPRSCPQRS